jgi:iron complex outermembrane recepter protein
VLALPSLLLALQSANAQQLTISGTVRDPQTVASGVSVILRNPSGMTQTITTDSTGVYRFESLIPGSYELSFVGQGFETTTRELSLTTESRTVDVTLSLSGASTTLQVIDIAGKATSSRMEIPDIDLPVQVSTIPNQLLEQQGDNDLVSALRNASGVTAQRFYGIYEYYTIRGFFGNNVMLVDGMRIAGNRINTQLNNVEEVEVLKGPSSILYGSGALGGAINVIRKQPQGQRSYDLFYRGGRFNRQQVGGGATGPLISNRLLYRVDSSFDHSDGWRGAGGDRFNISPSVNWLINDRNRLTVYESFNHDNFNGDGGLPVGVLSIPNFDLSRRLSTPWDFGHSRDLSTNVVFNSSLSPSWQFRDSFLHRRANDEYFVTEYPYLDPDFPAVYAVDRYALYFFHHWRPILNQADIIGRFKFLGMQHSILTGYEYEYVPDRYTTTADGGDHFPAPISLITFQETEPPITSFPTARESHFANRNNAVYWQDQISVTEHLKINIGGRYDVYHRTTQSNFFDDAGNLSTVGPTVTYDQTAYTYRAGAVYELPKSMQIYFSSSSSFNPVNIIPTTGPSLNPESGRLYEVGHRWQSPNHRFTTSAAFYKIERNNVVIALGMGRYDQAAQQSSKGVDFDLNGDLGYGVRLFANYGYTFARFDDYSEGGVDLSGNRPYYTPAHTGNAWLTKAWKSGFTASLGATYRSGMFTDNSNEFRLGGWTTFGGAASYRRGKLEYSVNAENLFNRQRYFFGADYPDLVYPGSPLNVFATIRYHIR